MERDWKLEATAALSGSLLEPPFGDLYVGGDPYAFVALRLVDHFFERDGSAKRLAVTPHRRAISCPTIN